MGEIILTVQCSSRACNLDIAGSDDDRLSVALTEVKRATVARHQEVFQLEFYCGLAMSGDPWFIEPLFVREQDVLFCDARGRLLLEARPAFLSQRIVRGYFRSIDLGLANQAI